MKLAISITVFLLSSLVMADTESSSDFLRLAIRAGGVYQPVSKIKIISYDEPIDFYDTFSLRASLEYIFSDFFSAGPAIEFASRKINPDATFSSEVTIVNIVLDGRLRNRLTDDGRSFLVAGAGSGIGQLEESKSGSAKGVYLYFMTGLDIHIGSNLGLDMLVRYSSERLNVENIREYQFEGLSFYTGINYGVGKR